MRLRMLAGRSQLVKRVRMSFCFLEFESAPANDLLEIAPAKKCLDVVSAPANGIVGSIANGA